MDQEIVELRMRLEMLIKENEFLRRQHELDMSQIVFQRRQIDFLMEGVKHEDQAE